MAANHGRDADWAIALSKPRKVYRRAVAIDDLTFAVPRGAVCGFVGPNGSGKTTTIRILLGLVRPSAGSGEVLGLPLSQPAAYLPRVGAIVEGPAFYPSLSGRDKLDILARLGGLTPNRVAMVLQQVHLSGRAGDPVRCYSLGMKQRLALAAALLPNPALLVLDEPTNGLDPSGIAETRVLLRSRSRSPRLAMSLPGAIPCT